MYDFIAYVMMMGSLSTGTNLPFWASANQFGIYPDSNGGLMQVYLGTSFNPEKAFHYRWGASFAARVDHSINGQSPDKIFPIDQLFGSIGWKCLTLDLGMKHRNRDFLGASPDLGSLSTTSGHLTWSGNARSMPGYNLILEKVAFPWTNKHLWFWGNFGDYATLGENYSKHALVHSMGLFFKVYFDSDYRFSFTGGLDHYAVWGGERYAKMVTFKNYLRVITGHSAVSDGSIYDQNNSIGDHGGSELMRFDYRGDRWGISFQHEIPYADKSGMKFQNFPDGVNTLAFSFKDKDRWVSDIVYEFYYTMFQSGSVHDDEFNPDGTPRPWKPGLNYIGIDNYYNNGQLLSGWTHFGRMITSPLFYPNGTRAGIVNRYAEVSSLASPPCGTENNRVIAHHLGLGGKLFRKAPYRLMATFSQNYGTYEKSYAGESPLQKPWGSVKETPLIQFSFGLNGEIPGSLFNFDRFAITYGLYCDAGQVLEKQFGAILGFRLFL